VCHAADDLDRAKPSRTITGPEARKTAPARLSKADQEFMTKAAASGLYEVEASRLAASRASDARVKAFANALISDHAQALESLKQVALNHNYPLPDQLAEDKRAVVSRLAALSGNEFDRAFLQQAGVADHESDIKMLERARRSTRAPDIKEWIDKTLPRLREHLRQALELKPA
jgi:putative membrane protein